MQAILFNFLFINKFYVEFFYIVIINKISIQHM